MHNTDDVDLRLDLRRACALLTERQFEVVSLVAQGLTEGEIAAELGINQSTVSRHLTSVSRKLASLFIDTHKTPLEIASSSRRA